jgi:hypothetical protein
MSACRGLHSNVTAGCKKDRKGLQIDEEDIATVQTSDSIAGGDTHTELILPSLPLNISILVLFL